MAVTVYRSTDTSAPVLTGQVGALVNVLDKCLVAGYGSKTAAGWTKPYTGTNAASFRQGSGNQAYLEVNDNGPGAGTAKEARATGYEAMTASATGTGQFPTTAQMATNLFIRKSTTADATGRAWVLIADDRTFYLFILTGDVAGQYYAFSFGEVYSYVSGTDNYRSMIVGRTTENSNLGGADWLDQLNAAGLTALSGHYMPRAYTGLATSAAVGKHGDVVKSGGAVVTRGTLTFPHGTDGKVWISPVTVHETTGPRGRMRGFYHYLHAVASFADQDTITGAGAYAGRTFLLLKTSPNAAVFCIDITGPWDTN